MDFPFPLLERRHGDRHFSDSESRWHHRSLYIPESSNGRVRLQLTIPWVDIESGRHIISVALTWPKLKPPPRDLKGLAEDVWERLVPGKYKRTDRSSLVGDLVKVPIKFNRWRAELFIRKKDRQLVDSLIRGEEHERALVSSGAINFSTVREAAIGSLVASLEWASRFFHPGWSREKDKLGWVYRMHFKTAMLVAEEVANLYLTDKLHPKDRKHLEKAYPTLEKIIKDAYRTRADRDPGVTPRRLALALLHVKFENVRSSLLDPNWRDSGLARSGLAEGVLWPKLLPPEERPRLEALRPAPSVQEMMSWPKAKTRDNELAKGFCNWWVCLVEDPLKPLHTLSDTDDDIRKRSFIAFLEYPGVERWASIVWDALHGPGIPIS